MRPTKPDLTWYLALALSAAMHIGILVAVRSPEAARPPVDREAVRITLSPAVPTPASVDPAPVPEPESEPDGAFEPEPVTMNDPEPLPTPQSVSDDAFEPEPATVPEPTRPPPDRVAAAPGRAGAPVRHESAGDAAAAPVEPTVRDGPTEGELEAYRRSVRRRIAAAQVYPLPARRREEEGVVVVRFTLNRRGSLTEEPEIRERARSARLNSAALDAVNGAAPYPPFDGDGWPDRITFVVPIRFVLD